MCQNNDIYYVEKLLKHRNKTFVGFKCLRKKVDWLDTRLMGKYQTHYTYQPGLNISDSKAKKVCRHNGHLISHGIHLFKDIDLAINTQRFDEVVVPFLCKKEHLIGANRHVIIFKQVVLPPEEYDNAIKIKRYITKYKNTPNI